MTRVCASPTCTKEFEPRTISNIYCSAECRSETTNNNLKSKYHENKARLKGELTRTCSKCNKTRLSRYNKSKVCEPCVAQQEEDARYTLLQQLGAV